MGYRVDGAGIARACLAAGPMFVTALALAGYVETAGATPLPVSVADLMLIPTIAVLLVPVTVVGAMLAIIPVMVGSAAMGALAGWVEEAASPGVWLTVGGAAAALTGLAVSRSLEPPALAALTATGAICAGLCRKGLREVAA